MRLENLRLEAERKEKKKQREQERKARLKAEGKLLTAKQKLDKARAQAMLDSLRAQGVEVPEVGEKRPRPGTRIRPNKKKDQLHRSESQEDQVKEEGGDNKIEDAIEIEEKKEDVPVVEKIKDSWDASSSEDEFEGTEKVEEKAKKGKQESEDESVDESEDDSEDDDDDEDSDSDDKSDGEAKTDAEAKRERAWERILVSSFMVLFRCPR